MLDQTPTRIQGKKFGIRAGAYIIDTITLYITNSIAGFIGGILLGVVFVMIGRPLALDDQRFGLLNLISGITLFILYYTLFEGFYGASLGKLVLGMRVVKTDGMPCGFRAAFVRAVLRLVDGLFFGLVAYSKMKQTHLQQRLGDKAADTMVIGHKDSFIQDPQSLAWFFIAGGIYFFLALVSLILIIAIALR